MVPQRQGSVTVLERGNVFFLYRPTEDRPSRVVCSTFAGFTWCSIRKSRNGSG